MSSPSSSESSSDDEEYNVKPIASLEDLPTDDSASLMSSSSSSSDDESSLEKKTYDAASSSRSSNDSSNHGSDDDSSDDKRIEERNWNVPPQQRGRQGERNDSESSNDDSSREDEDEMRNVPLEERIRQRQEAGMSNSARVNTRERKNQALQVATERLHGHKQGSAQETSKKKKKSKHKPTEVSSKRRDYFQRGAPTLDSSGVGVEITSHLYKPRDPRMLTSSTDGALDRNYEFLQEIRDKEIGKLKKQIAIRKLSGKKGQKTRRKLGLYSGSLQADQEELTRLQQEKAAYERAQIDFAAKQAVKRKMKQQVEAGKGVFYLKKREMKKVQLEAKLEELRKRGGDKAVDKALAKRRKKNKSKDAGYFIPKNV